ncbi:hypothetical protein EBT25_12310 [bacterium]|jgi:hypothetical protein|nr:hypothetical protein [bacterium]
METEQEIIDLTGEVQEEDELDEEEEMYADVRDEPEFMYLRSIVDGIYIDDEVTSRGEHGPPNLHEICRDVLLENCATLFFRDGEPAKGSTCTTLHAEGSWRALDAASIYGKRLGLDLETLVEGSMTKSYSPGGMRASMRFRAAKPLWTVRKKNQKVIYENLDVPGFYLTVTTN